MYFHSAIFHYGVKYLNYTVRDEPHWTPAACFTLDAIIQKYVVFNPVAEISGTSSNLGLTCKGGCFFEIKTDYSFSHNFFVISAKNGKQSRLRRLSNVNYLSYLADEMSEAVWRFPLTNSDVTKLTVEPSHRKFQKFPNNSRSQFEKVSLLASFRYYLFRSSKRQYITILS